MVKALRRLLRTGDLLLDVCIVRMYVCNMYVMQWSVCKVALCSVQYNMYNV